MSTFIFSVLATGSNVSSLRYLTWVPRQFRLAWLSEASLEIGFARRNAMFEHHLYIIYKPSSMPIGHNIGKENQQRKL